MEVLKETQIGRNRPWKKALCVLLSLIIAFGTLVTLTVGSSRLQDWLGIQSMLSAYAAEFVETKGAVAVNEEAMLADAHVIDLENRDGSNTVYLFSEPISYTDADGHLKTKDISIEKQTDAAMRDKGYGYTNGQNDYRIHFAEDAGQGVLVQFDGGTYSIVPQGRQNVQGKESTSAFLQEEFEVFAYENLYGDGTNLKFYPQLNGVKDEIVLERNIGQDVFSFTLQTENCTAVLNEDGTVSLKSSKDDSVVQTFPAPFAYDSVYVEGDYDAHYSACTYALEETGENTYTLSVQVSADWLNSEDTVYPVVIEPNDGFASAKQLCSVTNYTNDQTAPTIDSVSGNPTDWTRGNVTLTVHGAKDNSGGEGLHEMPYSFSTVKNQYCWQASKSQTFTSNCTVYIYVRDALGNIALCSTQKIDKIDKTAPVLETVTQDESGKGVTLSTTAEDKDSGVLQYSFSSTKGVYDWQSENTKTYSEDGTVYVYAKDNAGNISDPGEVEIACCEDIDEAVTDNLDTQSENSSGVNAVQMNMETRSTVANGISGNAVQWTNADVTLAVDNASAFVSNLHATGYSFSTTESVFEWQAENSKTFSSNGTVYIYLRDAAGNIVLADTVVIDKIDKNKPDINDVTWVDADGQTTVTVDAADAESGVALYSFDDGATWSAENTYTLKTDSKNYLVVKVKDNAGNVTSHIVNFYQPQLYTDGKYFGIYNPNPNCKSKIYYSFTRLAGRKEYKKPFIIPAGKTTIYLFFTSRTQAGNMVALPQAQDKIGLYTEANVDASLSYRTSNFDFFRSYDGEAQQWYFSLNSHIESDKNGSIIYAVLPDATRLPFVPKGEDTYIRESTGDIMTVQRDENQTDITGYTFSTDDVTYTFNADGKLTSVSSLYEDTITFTRTSDKILVTDGAQRTYTAALDANGNILSVTDPAGGVITYTYDAQNRLKTVVDQAGITLGSYQYDEAGRLIKSMDKAVLYNEDNKIEKYLYDSGAYSVFTYDSNTVSVQTGSEQQMSMQYDRNGKPTSVTSPSSGLTLYKYDDNLNLIEVIQNGKTTEMYAYDSKGNLMHKQETDGDNIIYDYDGANRCIRRQTNSGSDRKFEYFVYDAFGNMTVYAEWKGDSDKSPISYNETLTSFDTIKYTYDNGLMVKSVNAQQNETTIHVHDQYGQTIKASTTMEEDGQTSLSVTDYTYDLLGNVLTASCGENVTTNTYDAAGRILLEDEDGDCTRTLYDTLGRTVQEIGSEDYDAAKDGLPEENTYADAKAGHTYVYAENNTLVSETNRYGETTTYTYSSVGTLHQKHFDIYDYFYLPNGNCDKIAVAGETVVDYRYQVDVPEITLKKGEYLNQVVYRNGAKKTYKYSAQGSLLAEYSKSDTEPSVEYTYSKAGELTQKLNTDLGLKYIYSDNQVKVYRIFDDTLVQSYAQTETEADENAGTEAFTTVAEMYDGMEYSSVIRDNSVAYTCGENTLAYGFEADADGQLASDGIQYNNHQVFASTYSYDEETRIEEKAISFDFEAEEGVLVQRCRYDEKGQIIATGDEEWRRFYTYDEDGQLIRADNSETGYSEEYVYDDRGNVTEKRVHKYTTGDIKKSLLIGTKQFEYRQDGWKDQLVSALGIELTYDENGNVLTAGGRHFTWERGRILTQITDGADKTYSYTYDENGIRTGKTVNGVTTRFTTKNGVVVSQTDGKNTLYFQYDSFGTPIGFLYNGTQYFYLTNQMGDVVGIIDTAGNLIAEYIYDDWGRLSKIQTANDTKKEKELAEANPLRYRGYYYDNETGYYYLQSRYYDPFTSRFINADSFDYVDTNRKLSTNAYAYCENDPVKNMDIDGHKIKNSDVPPAASGYIPPKGGPKQKKVEKGRLKGKKGWVDKDGNIWIPDPSTHGGDHWDVVDKNGKNHRNVYPDGYVRMDDSNSLDDLLNSILNIYVPSADVLFLALYAIVLGFIMYFFIMFALPMALLFIR